MICALVTGVHTCALPIYRERLRGAGPRQAARGGGPRHRQSRHRPARFPDSRACRRGGGEGGARRPPWLHPGQRQDRKSAEKGKGVSVRVDLGGRRRLKKKTTKHDKIIT